jgi:hypothetical protein
MFNKRPIISGSIISLISAFCMIIAGYLLLFFDLTIIIEFFIVPNTSPSFDYPWYIGVFCVVIIATLIGWVIADFQNTVFSINYCGTKYAGFTKLNDGYISTIWLAIFGIPILPIKSMWFYTDKTQIPSRLDHIYLPQIFSTLCMSVIKIFLVNLFLILLFTAIKIIVVSK